MTAWTAHVTVATVVEKHGKFLLVEEHSEGFSHPVFNQPAGHVEAGETIIEAAIRETREETGHDVEIDHLLGFTPIRPPCSQTEPIFVSAFWHMWLKSIPMLNSIQVFSKQHGFLSRSYKTLDVPVALW